MRVILKPLPVLVACAGCAEHGNFASEAAAELERQGKGDRAWLGGDRHAVASKARARWPVFVFDACRSGCARAWCERHGVTPQRCYILEDMRIPSL